MLVDFNKNEMEKKKQKSVTMKLNTKNKRSIATNVIQIYLGFLIFIYKTKLWNTK